MKGFGIYVKNNLLEPKHIENMDAAVWLYLWLLDKMTSVNESGIGKVLGGMPVTYATIKDELGLTERTYRRWTDKLRDTGYIRTMRTPYGLVFTVTKAEKIYKSSKRSAKSGTSKKLSDTPNMAHHSERDVPNVSGDVPNSPPVRPNMAQTNKTIQDNTIDNTNTTNVVGAEAPVRHGRADINELFDYWAAELEYNIESKVTANRRAASNLIKKHGLEKAKRLVAGVAMAQADRYAPRIADFCDLQSKQSQLIAWGRTKMHDYAENKGVKL